MRQSRALRESAGHSKEVQGITRKSRPAAVLGCKIGVEEVTLAAHRSRCNLVPVGPGAWGVKKEESRRLPLQHSIAGAAGSLLNLAREDDG